MRCARQFFLVACRAVVAVSELADDVSGEARPCDAEIADVKWFALDALPQLPGPVRISRQLINATIDSLRLMG